MTAAANASWLMIRVGRDERERQEHVARLRDARVREQPHDLPLLERDEVPDRHRQDRQHREDRRPELRTAPGTRRTSAGAGPRSPRPSTPSRGTPRPGPARPRTCRAPRTGTAPRSTLNANPATMNRIAASTSVSCPASSGTASAAPISRQVQRPGDAVDQAHPVEHHRGREHADQEELHAGLVRTRVGLAERRDQERRARDTSSSAMNSISRSREDGMIRHPRNEVSSRK